MRYFLTVASTVAALLSGCSARSSPGSLLPETPNVHRTARASPANGRCDPFLSTFDELVACRRADGTLRSFADWEIAWRVRYFVRYWRMPCGETPTVPEAYVFHMVTNDLYVDESLDDSQRLAIRAAMFSGNVRCRSDGS